MRAKLAIPDALERDEIEAAVKATRTKGLVISAVPQRAPT
jgi:hypothetical protein